MINHPGIQIDGIKQNHMQYEYSYKNNDRVAFTPPYH